MAKVAISLPLSFYFFQSKISPLFRVKPFTRKDILDVRPLCNNLLGSVEYNLKKISISITVLAIALILAISMPLFSFAAASTVTVQTNFATYPGVAGTPIVISGTISPAPGTSGYSVTLEINTTQGLLAVYSTSVNGANGAYSYTMTTGYAANGWITGTYIITAVYATSANGPTYTGSATFQYGSATTSTTTTSTTTSSATATTVTTTVTSTVGTTQTTTQTATSSITGPTVTTTVPTTVSTTVTAPTVTTTTTVSSATWLYVGIAGILVAVIVGALAAVMMMRRH